MEVDTYIQENKELIKNLCKKYTTCSYNADDIFQDFYLYLREKHPCNLKKATGYFFGFLMKNKHFKNNPERAYTSFDIELTNEPIHTPDYESKQQVEVMRSKLPEPYKRIFDMVFMEGNLSENELAARLNCTRYAARQSRAKLFELLEIKQKSIKFVY